MSCTPNPDGVHLTKGRWRAVIVRDGKEHYLGRFATFEEAIAARRTAELRFPDRGVRGRNQRRYPAPPGMRACCNPDCAGGPVVNGTPTRYVGPEDSFPKSGKYRKGHCRACDRRAVSDYRHKAYRADPDRYLDAAEAQRRKRRAKRDAERLAQAGAVTHAIAVLLADGWTNARIGAAVGVHATCISNWRHAQVKNILKHDAVAALLALAATHGARP